MTLAGAWSAPSRLPSGPLDLDRTDSSIKAAWKFALTDRRTPPPRFSGDWRNLKAEGLAKFTSLALSPTLCKYIFMNIIICKETCK